VSYDPARGAPDWRADGTGTATTLEEFETQRVQFLAWNEKFGLIQQTSPGTFSNAIAFDSRVTPQLVRDLIKPPVVVPPIEKYVPETILRRREDLMAGVVKPLIPDVPEALASGVDRARELLDKLRGAGGGATGEPSKLDDCPSCPAGLVRSFRFSDRTCSCVPPLNVPATPLPLGLGSSGMASPVLGSRFNSAFGGGGFGGFSSGLSGGEIGTLLTPVANAGCASITNAALRQLCLAGVGLGGAILGSGSTTATGGAGAYNSGRSASLDPTGGLAPQNCPQGYVPDGRGGCQLGGVSGAISRVLPGDIGRQDRVYNPTGGMGGVAPQARATTVLRCPKRYALGLDNVCYPKPMLPRQFRKWVPERKPLLTGGEVRVLTRAKSLAKRVRKLSGKYAPKAKSCSCSKGPRKK